MSFLNQTTLDELIASYGYIAIFGIILLESAGIPLPGETILIAAAIYAGSHDSLDIRWIIATAAAAAILGDNIGYWGGVKLGGQGAAQVGIFGGPRPAEARSRRVSFSPAWRQDRVSGALRGAAPRICRHA